MEKFGHFYCRTQAAHQYGIAFLNAARDESIFTVRTIVLTIICKITKYNRIVFVASFPSEVVNLLYPLWVYDSLSVLINVRLMSVRNK